MITDAELIAYGYLGRRWREIAHHSHILLRSGVKLGKCFRSAVRGERQCVLSALHRGPLSPSKDSAIDLWLAYGLLSPNSFVIVPASRNSITDWHRDGGCIGQFIEELSSLDLFSEVLNRVSWMLLPSDAGGDWMVFIAAQTYARGTDVVRDLAVHANECDVKWSFLSHIADRHCWEGAFADVVLDERTRESFLSLARGSFGG